MVIKRWPVLVTSRVHLFTSRKSRKSRKYTMIVVDGHGLMVCILDIINVNAGQKRKEHTYIQTSDSSNDEGEARNGGSLSSCCCDRFCYCTWFSQRTLYRQIPRKSLRTRSRENSILLFSSCSWSEWAVSETIGFEWTVLTNLRTKIWENSLLHVWMRHFICDSCHLLSCYQETSIIGKLHYISLFTIVIMHILLQTCVTHCLQL